MFWFLVAEIDALVSECIIIEIYFHMFTYFFKPLYMFWFLVAEIDTLVSECTHEQILSALYFYFYFSTFNTDIL